jgi:hypothetical protein
MNRRAMMEMDVNDLLLKQQLSLWHAQFSRSRAEQVEYERLAQSYIARIDAYREANARSMAIAH